MSHQCSCGRDLNNNYVSYTNAYANPNSGIDRESSSTMSVSAAHLGVGSKSSLQSSSMSSKSSSSGAQTQLTAKVMFGTVGAIKELREKEKSSRLAATRASDHRN